MPKHRHYRRLVIALGDQLSTRLPSLKGFDKSRDAVWMAEVSEESVHTWSSKTRIVLFLSAMRHFRDELRQKGYVVRYKEFSEGSLSTLLEDFLAKNEVDEVHLVRPGEHRLLVNLSESCSSTQTPLRLHEDTSFYSTPADFEDHARGRKQLRMEFFYREMRRKHQVLMDGKNPRGGEWNFDSQNRKAFPRSGPELLPPRKRFPPDDTTNAVIKLVNEKLPNHPGTCEDFDWPVTREQGLAALQNFIQDELARFGKHQDAMWAGEPFLHHSLISSSLNLHLIDADEAVSAAEHAYNEGLAPIESVEGFIRQILGWREYVRGIYWSYMPEYLERNAFEAELDLPDFFWTGNTEYNCLRDTISQTLKFGYAHHIQRLMVTGLYCLLLGVHPKKVHQWYLSVYVDAVEWVELPNTLGMSQFADGSVMASKPYVATGQYIKRMSNYCSGCRFDPTKRTGSDACPFTTLYWDFLTKHRVKLHSNPRMRMQLRNLDRIDTAELQQISLQAAAIREQRELTT
ncbi:cryptochrome/photolyase family protein [Pelagicoccus mobilis]|uniref:Cryptochrome/photolyase family protein n=1 Tax=Pelagicoccus mobilis TaxID=415221 RepID=A0A934RYH8_9BACT|nr:cryptochrome/photolyase family protein [Pelagicoccus mobilis]MBK1880060.1 cryptochrome/photolyase family protein [Pelagicoccus mobilis]